MTIIEQINQENIKAEVPAFNVGDTVKVSVKLPIVAVTVCSPTPH